MYSSSSRKFIFRIWDENYSLRTAERDEQRELTDNSINLKLTEMLTTYAHTQIYLYTLSNA